MMATQEGWNEAALTHDTYLSDNHVPFDMERKTKMYPKMKAKTAKQEKNIARNGLDPWVAHNYANNRPQVEVTIQCLSGIIDHRKTLNTLPNKTKCHNSKTEKGRLRRWNWMRMRPEASRKSRKQNPVATDNATTSNTYDSELDDHDRVVATVGFAGSGVDTRVNTSIVCPHTGLAILEADRTERYLQPPPQSRNKPQPSIPKKGQERMNSHEISSSVSREQLAFTWSRYRDLHQQTLPHATLLLRQRDPKVPTKSLPAIHKNSYVVTRCHYTDEVHDNSGFHADDEVARILETTDTASTATDLTDLRFSVNPSENMDLIDDGATVLSSISLHTGSTGRGDSVIWSASDAGTTLPDIIEMQIRIRDPTISINGKRHGPGTTDLIGVAYLVLFGHPDDIGKAVVLNLPVKIPPELSAASIVPSSSAFSFSEQGAFLRIHIRVLSPSPSDSCSDSSTETASQRPNDLQANKAKMLPPPMETRSTSYMMKMMDSYVAQIQDNEKAARAFCQSQKRAMDIYVPKADGFMDRTKQDTDKTISSTCDVVWNWDRFLSTLHCAMNPSLPSTGDEEGGERLNLSYDEVSSHQLIASDASTIATRDSLLI
jgi:hypothetical protein